MTDPAELTLDRLNDLLTFDPESGTFSWNENRGSARRGDVAGSVTNKGYVRKSKTLGKFDASIRFSGRQIHIGTYISAELAYDAYVAAKRKIHEGCLL